MAAVRGTSLVAVRGVRFDLELERYSLGSCCLWWVHIACWKMLDEQGRIVGRDGLIISLHGALLRDFSWNATSAVLSVVRARCRKTTGKPV